MRILIIEDEKKVANALREGLEAEHYEVTIAATGEDGFFLASQGSFDLLLLDLMLPRRDGIDVLATLRKCGNQTPVLVLTARDAVEDRVIGLDQGADDYLTKPFAFSELLARVEALLRRSAASNDAPATRLKVADLEMDLLSRRVARAGRDIELTAREFKLLEFLLRHAGQVVTRTMLLEGVWDLQFDPQTNLIDVHLSRLRQAVDRGFSKPLIHTVRGAGYVIRDEDQPA